MAGLFPLNIIEDIATIMSCALKILYKKHVFKTKNKNNNYPTHRRCIPTLHRQNTRTYLNSSF